jgi:hypothetical protein
LQTGAKPSSGGSPVRGRGADVDVVGAAGDGSREVLVHLIEEYARHKATPISARVDRRAGRE